MNRQHFLARPLFFVAVSLLFVGCGSKGGGDADIAGDTVVGDVLSTDGNDANLDGGDELDQGDAADIIGGFDGCDLGDAIWGRPSGTFEDHRLQFAGEGGVRVAIARTYISVGVGESAIYELAAMAIDQGDGIEACLRDPSQLDYENTHHNWMDVATATAGSVRYELSIFYLVVPDDQGRTGDLFEIRAYDSNDQVVWGPVELTLDNPE